MKRKGKIIILAVIFIFIILILCVCKNNSDETNGNLANMGLAVEDNGTIYYNKYEKGIFSVKGDKELQLTDETAYSLNIYKDKIYYLSIADFNNVVIKCVDIDGKNRTNIATVYTTISKIYVQNGFIYYASNNGNGGIARISLKDKSEEIILSQKLQDFEVVNNDVFYINDQNKICKFSAQENVILNDTVNAKKIQIVGKWIYYYDENENALFRLSKDGTEKELISVLVNNEIYNVSGKYVYYFDKANSKISRMRIGKNNKTNEIVPINISKTKINIVGDNIYYLDKSKDESQTYQIYRVKVNGEKIAEIEY